MLSGRGLRRSNRIIFRCFFKREYDYADVCRQVDELVASSVKEDDMGIVRRMKEMVPEFKSKHSVYEVLDK